MTGKEDLMEFLSRYFGAVQSDIVSYWLVIGIGVWFAFALFIPRLTYCVIGTKWLRRFVGITPSGLATLGVLGTFWGIFVGLLDFDVTHIDESVPALLDGLKIAFSTSIAGMTAAIFFRIGDSLLPMRATTSGNTAEDIHAILRISHESANHNATNIVEELSRLRNTISSDNDSSLVTQMQKMRTTLADGQSDLIKEFRTFAERMTENNQKAIIEALEQVIRDFNENLTEQFGENFKELNRAVHALVEWQDRYRQHIEDMETRLELGTEAVEEARQALIEISSRVEKIPEMIKPLESLLTGLQAQVNDLDAHLNSVADLRDKAMEAFPVIEDNLKQVTDGFAKSVDGVSLQLQNSLDEGKKTQDKLQTGYENLLRSAEQSQQQFSTQLTNAISASTNAMEETARTTGELVKKSWEDSQQKMKNNFDAFDNQMQDELKRAIEALGRQLASLSEKFVSDYTPLTQKLRQLIEISKNL